MNPVATIVKKRDGGKLSREEIATFMGGFVSGDVPGLAAGVYHYSAYDHALRQLRAGDFRQIIVRATANEPDVVHAPAVRAFIEGL